MTTPDAQNPYAPPQAHEPGPPKRLELDGFVYLSLNTPGWFLVIALAAFMVLTFVAIGNATIGAGMPDLSRVIWGWQVVVAGGFCWFLPRANRNARYFGYEPLEFTPRWSAGVFFVPIWNFYKPYRSVRELWWASESNREVQPLPARTTGLLPLWWGSWICTVVLSRSIGRVPILGSITLPDALSIAAAGSCMALVLQLMRRFEVRVLEVAAADRARLAAERSAAERT